MQVSEAALARRKIPCDPSVGDAVEEHPYTEESRKEQNQEDSQRKDGERSNRWTCHSDTLVEAPK